MKIASILVLAAASCLWVSSCFSALIPPVPEGLSPLAPRISNSDAGSFVDQVYNDGQSNRVLTLRLSTMKADVEAAEKQLKAFRDPNYMGVMNSFPNSVYKLEESDGVISLYDERNGTSRVKRIEGNIIVDVIYHNVGLATLKKYMNQFESSELKSWALNPSAFEDSITQGTSSLQESPAAGFINQGTTIVSSPGSTLAAPQQNRPSTGSIQESVDSYRNALLKVSSGIPVHRNLDVKVDDSDSRVVGAVIPDTVGAAPVAEDRWANVGAHCADEDGEEADDNNDGTEYHEDNGDSSARVVYNSLKDFIPLSAPEWRIIRARTKKTRNPKGYKFKYRCETNDAGLDGRLFKNPPVTNQYYKQMLAMEKSISQSGQEKNFQTGLETRGRWKIYFKVPTDVGYDTLLNATDGTYFLHFEGNKVTKKALFDLFNAFDIENLSAFSKE